MPSRDGWKRFGHISFYFFRRYFISFNEEEEKEIIMRVELYNDNELRIGISKDTDEILALVKALKDLEEMIEKKAKLSKEQLSTAITNYDDNDLLGFRKITYAMDEFKEKQESLSEIRNLIKYYSNDLNLNA